MAEPLPLDARAAGSPGICGLIGADLRDGKNVRYTELGARSLLNRCDTPRMPDCWTINPYRGCSFGCHYCYARYTHEYLGVTDPDAFARHVFVKVGAAETLEREATATRLRARPIAIGTVTDPYQPAESRYRLTAGVLGVLARHRGLRISLTTKSALVMRDIDLLTRISRRSALSVHISLITTDRDLARRLDPGAPSPSRRLATVRSLADAGIDVGINAMPILPAINDGPEDLRRLFVAAREKGAGWVVAVPLFLASISRRHFFAWLRAHAPDHLPLYRHLYRQGIDVDSAWRRDLARRIERIRSEAGVPSASPRYGAGAYRDSVQLALPGVEAVESARSGRRTSQRSGISGLDSRRADAGELATATRAVRSGGHGGGRPWRAPRGGPAPADPLPDPVGPGRRHRLRERHHR